MITKEESEKTYLKNVLQLTGGNISRAAEFGGWHPTEFDKMLREYGFNPSCTQGTPEPDIEESSRRTHSR